MEMNARTQKTIELEILNQAIEAFREETGVEIKILGTEVEIAGTDRLKADARIRIEPVKKQLNVEIKRHAQHTNVGMLIKQIKRLPDENILVADYINPNLADKLKHENIQYLDTAGNAFLNQYPLYVFINGRKSETQLKTMRPQNARRAFEPKGLLVTYAFLKDPNLLNCPYREIAAATNVAVGTVGWVVNALKAGKYIYEDTKTGKRLITNYQKLLDRWAETWPEKLKPNLLLGEYLIENAPVWEIFPLEEYNGFWGGEAAAAWYTDNLKPEVITIYMPKKQHRNFIRDWQLGKANELNNKNDIPVHIYDKFWPVDDFDQLQKANPDLGIEPGFVNPVLAYADLIATGDGRNIEIANKLYEERIARR